MSRSILRPQSTRLVLLLLGVLLSVVSTARSVRAQPTISPSAITQSETPKRALQPGDGIRLRIFQEVDLSGDFPVDDRQIVVLPRLGEISVAGVPADSLRARIRAAYRRFLTTEAVEVTPYRRIAVTGAVLKPGLYPVDPTMSVGDAIILAGGISQIGRADRVEVRQAGAQAGAAIGSETRIWDSGVGGARQLYVPERSWISRNALAASSVLISLITATAFLISARR